MLPELEQFQYSVSVFIRSLRLSMDRHYRNRPLKGEIEREHYSRSRLLVEEASIGFESYFKGRHDLAASYWQAARNQLTSFVDRFVETDLTAAIFDASGFAAHTHAQERELIAHLMSYLPLGAGDLTVGEALIGFRRYLENLTLNVETAGTQLSFDDVLASVPKQQIGPIQFAVNNDRISVVRNSPNVVEADRANIEAAAEHIRLRGERLIEDLRGSNCDRRLLECVGELHSQIVTNGNIIRIALANIDSSTMAAQFQAELPDASMAMLVAYHSNISLYVAQFPEWRQYVSKADALQLDDSDAAAVEATLDRVIGELKSRPELADPDVPRLLQYVREFRASPGTSRTRVAYAMIRSIENLVSSILHHGASFISKTTDRSIDASSKVAATAVAGMLVVALLGLTGIGPTAIRASSPWVKQAIEILEKQLGKGGGLH